MPKTSTPRNLCPQVLCLQLPIFEKTGYPPPRERNETMIEDVRYREIAGGGLILAAAAVVMSLLSYSTADIILAGE